LHFPIAVYGAWNNAEFRETQPISHRGMPIESYAPVLFLIAGQVGLRPSDDLRVQRRPGPAGLPLMVDRTEWWPAEIHLPEKEVFPPPRCLRGPSASLNQNLPVVTGLIVPVSPCRGHAISIPREELPTHRARNSWTALTRIRCSEWWGPEYTRQSPFLACKFVRQDGSARWD